MKNLLLLILSALLSLSPLHILEPASPTQTFIENHPINSINSTLNRYGMNANDKALFISAIQNENDAFIGYHGGSKTYMLFQDIIRMVIEEKFCIAIPETFHFLRIPGTEELIYPNAKAFIDEFIPSNPPFGDDRPETRIHILSLNTSLYQSYLQPWDLTARYYLENTPWTSPAFANYLRDFFSEAGLDPLEVENIFQKIANCLPHNRGFIMQFFDASQDNEFLNTHFYVSHSGGNPYANWIPSEFLQYPLINKQLRLVIDNHHILNPFGKLTIKRYDSLTDELRATYQNELRALIADLEINPAKQAIFKTYLLDLWK